MVNDFAGKDLPLELEKFDTIKRSERREAKSLAAAKRRVVRNYVLAQRAAQIERRGKHALARAKGGPGQAAFWYAYHNRMTVLIEVAGLQLLELPVRIASVARATNLSRPVVRQIIDDAEAVGYIDAQGRLSADTEAFFCDEIFHLARSETTRAFVRAAAVTGMLKGW